MKKEYTSPECIEMGKFSTDTLVSWNGSDGDGVFVEQNGRPEGVDDNVGPLNGHIS